MLIVIVISLVVINNEDKNENLIHEKVRLELRNCIYIEDNTLNLISKKELLKMNSIIESNGKWNVANKHGYLGKYQIGKKVLLDLGYDSTWINELISSIYVKSDTILRKNNQIVRNFYYFDLLLFPPSKQDEVVLKMINKNEKVYLKKHIDEYVGKEIDGVRITKAGILSASFIGFGYVDKFLSSNGRVNPSDANGHTIKDRLKHFQDYELK